MNDMKIVSWQSVLTDHQSHTMRALQDMTGAPLVIVSGVRELGQRKSQGWTVPDMKGLNVQYLAQSGWWKQGVAILCENMDAIHLFNGLWADRRFFLLLLEAQRRGVQTVLMSEPYSEVAVGTLNESTTWKEQFKVSLRPWLYKLAGFLVARRLKAVFAISRKAVEQFSRIGVRRERICPFGYFIPAKDVHRPAGSRSGNRERVRFVFVGSLIRRKGIHALMEAMMLCEEKGLDIELDIYGPGDADILCHVEGVTYQGAIPFGQAQEVICMYDVLVLPSLYDGWGVVVNEALLQGVPVIVSDQVGAKVLVEKSGAGEVVVAGDAEALVRSFENLVNNPDKLTGWMKHALAFRACLSPEVAANYLYKSLSFSLGAKNDNPWYMI